MYDQPPQQPEPVVKSAPLYAPVKAQGQAQVKPAVAVSDEIVEEVVVPVTYDRWWSRMN